MRGLRWAVRLIGPGAWLWELSLVSWALLASYFVWGREGHLDWTRHALGRDFINAWTAGHLVWSGQVADIFDPRRFLGHERALFDRRLPFHFWSYPPPNLFLVAPLGFTGYFTGLALWSLAGIAALPPRGAAVGAGELAAGAAGAVAGGPHQHRPGPERRLHRGPADLRP